MWNRRQDEDKFQFQQTKQFHWIKQLLIFHVSMNFPRDWYVVKPGFTCYIVPLIAYDGLVSIVHWHALLCALWHDLAEKPWLCYRAWFGRKFGESFAKGFCYRLAYFFSITGHLTLRDGSKTMESMDSPSALVTSDESSLTTLSETANINTSQVTNGTSGVNSSTLSFCPFLFSFQHSWNHSCGLRWFDL